MWLAVGLGRSMEASDEAADVELSFSGVLHTHMVGVIFVGE